MVDIPKNRIPPTSGPAGRADVCTAPAYTYMPVAPSIPDEAPLQRYFTHGLGRKLKLAFTPDVWQEIYLMRFADCAEAELKIRLYGFGSCSETSIKLSATQCRDLASRLLDAAHDIEVVA